LKLGLYPAIKGQHLGKCLFTSKVTLCLVDKFHVTFSYLMVTTRSIKYLDNLGGNLQIWTFEHCKKTNFFENYGVSLWTKGRGS